MIARICTKTKCKTISPLHECAHCQALTTPLPTIQLGMLGLHARASLHYTQEDHYYLQIDKPSGRTQISVEIQDLRFNAQPHLPHIEEDTGLMIMDTLKSAASLILTRETPLRAGWVLYLTEAIQAGTDKLNYQTMLGSLLIDLRAKLEKSHRQEGAP